MYPFSNRLIIAKIKKEVASSARNHFSSNAHEVIKITNKAFNAMGKDLQLWASMIRKEDLDDEELYYLLDQSDLKNLDYFVEKKGFSETSMQQYKTELLTIIAQTMHEVQQYKLPIVNLTLVSLNLLLR